MPDKNKSKNMIVGIKQTIRMVERRSVSEVFVAQDADHYVTKSVIEAAKANNIPIRYVESKKKLGHLCGIEIGASTAATVKESPAAVAAVFAGK